MSDDIVTRLRNGHGEGCSCFARCYCECGCDAIWAEHYTTEAADEIERLRADVKRWHTIATNLIHGAEQQIDAFREPWDKSTNEAWLGAWHDYHQAVLDEGAK